MQLVDRIVAPFRGAEAALPRSVVAAAPALLTVALVIVLAAQLASLLWRVLGSTGAETMPTPAVDAGAVPAVDLGSIVNAHLFGVASLSGDPNSALATSANLALAGTLAGLDPEQGWAIIGASAQAARVYATGATLPGGARLFAVYPDRVILDRNGTRESLALPRFSGGSGAPPVAYQPDDSQSGSLVDSVRQLMGQDQSAVNELLRPQPVFAGAQLRGYRVYPGRNRGQFAKLGLQPGDLVTAVNGAPLDDPNRALEALRGVGMGPAVTLTIDRHGQQQQLAIDPGTVVQELQPASEPEPSPEDESSE
ncbi:MAG: type II secretion system protein GspC [Gammaproteobacteria bacterium]|nr:type II secretion system protein GspC [Gammaproteobacteria bacterium]